MPLEYPLFSSLTERHRKSCCFTITMFSPTKGPGQSWPQHLGQISLIIIGPFCQSKDWRPLHIKLYLARTFFFQLRTLFGKVGLMVGFQPEAFYSVRFYTRSLSESDIELGHLLNLCQKLACSMENCRDFLKSQQKNPGEIGSTHSSTSLPQMISKIANLVGLQPPWIIETRIGPQHP